MAHLDLYGQIALLLLLAVLLAAAALPFRLPAVLAYLACGLLFGPAGIDLGLRGAPVELFGHLGISLLLLVVGLRLDVHLLRALGLRVLWAALLQIGLTWLLGALLFLGYGGFAPLYAGLALALSSTVLVVKLLSDRREIDALYGRIALAILLVQDLVVVLALGGVALLGGERPSSDLLLLPLKGLLFLLAVGLSGRYLLPPLLGYLARSRELLMLAALAFGLGLGFLGHAIGFSHELGAFLGGVALAATPYREALSSRLVALRDFLLPFFFVQLGSFLDPGLLADVWPWALLLAGAVLTVRPLLILLLLRLFGFGLYNGGLAALTLGQVSEFSLILAWTGLERGHLPPSLVALLTATAFLTMALSSLAIANLHPLFHALFPLLRPLARREAPFCPLPEREVKGGRSALVIGLGRYGLRLAHRLRTFGFGVLGFDFDPLRLREARQEGISAHYLDAEDIEAIERLPLDRVDWVVLTLRFPAAVETAVRGLREAGFRGRIAAVAYRQEDRRRLERLGIDLLLLPDRDAADHAAELIRGFRPRAGARPPWHALPPEEVCRLLGVQPEEGLTFAEAKRRLAAFGENRLPSREAPSFFELLFRQFESFLILILVAAAALAWWLGDLRDAVAILIVVLLNAALGLFQEFRAERALLALRQMVTQKVRVMREGRAWLLPVEELVPGDIVLLEAGDRVPADGRLLEATGLMVDESPLTGESLPVAKRVEPVPEESPLAERRSLVFMNTFVTKGRGRFVVTATGTETEIGRLAKLLAEEEEPRTPLQRQLDLLGRRLALLVLVVVALLLGFSWWRGEPLFDAFFTSVALAVAAIPEGLPAVVTVTLAVGMHRLARRNAVVRRLVAVETLGCVSVICSDKTGTLTQNRLRVERLYFRGKECSPEQLKGLELERIAPLLLPAVLCNEATEAGGDPLEVALLEMASSMGIDWKALRERYPKLAEIPFEADLRFMATFHDLGEEEVLLCVKGAPEVLLARSRACLEEEEELPLKERLQAWRRANEALAEQGLRVVGTAWKRLKRGRFQPEDSPQELLRLVEGLTLTGWIGLLDPPRPEAPQAIETCREAGIAVKVVTGDQPLTARAIARLLGLEGEVITGAELEGLPLEVLAEKIDRIALFARTTPEQKVQIVRALQARGKVVAVTGDGVNDAPALKVADIGIAMGSGTEVAKEAADMVLLDDNFATIVAAVEGGRAIYENILKFLRFQLSTNFAAILAIAAAPLFGLPLPFHPIQLLWINVIMDGPPAMALGVDPPDPKLMARPPRAPSEPILTGGRLLLALYWGAVRAAGTLAVLAPLPSSGRGWRSRKRSP